MYLSALPEKLIVGRIGPLQCESSRYFWGKTRYQDGPAKSDIDIAERLGGIGRGIYIAVKREALLMKGETNGKQREGKCYR